MAAVNNPPVREFDYGDADFVSIKKTISRSGGYHLVVVI